MCVNWLRANWWMAHFWVSFAKKFLLRHRDERERGQGFFQGSSFILVDLKNFKWFNHIFNDEILHTFLVFNTLPNREVLRNNKKYSFIFLTYLLSLFQPKVNKNSTCWKSFGLALCDHMIFFLVMQTFIFYNARIPQFATIDFIVRDIKWYISPRAFVNVCKRATSTMLIKTKHKITGNPFVNVE